MLEFEPFVGCYRRVIDLRTWDKNTVVGWLEDDFHHFGTTLVHDGHVVTDVRIAAVRYSWSPCPAAVEPLKKLIGQPLVGRCTEIGGQIDMRLQCTHLFDLAGLLSAHAFHGREHHRYHATVDVIRNDPAKPAWLAASLIHDDRSVLSWELHQDMIMAPRELAGLSIDRGFRPWTESLDEIPAERASILRRALFVARAKSYRLRINIIPDAATTPSVCFAYQSENRVNAVRDGEASAVRQFDNGTEGMLALVDSKP